MKTKPPSHNGRKSGIYIRLTREESLKTGLSAPAQRHDGKEYFRGRGLTEVVIFEEDEAVSGEVPFLKRKKGKELWESIESGELENIYARALDRYCRNISEWNLLVKLCFKHDCTIHIATGPVPLNSAAEIFAADVQMAAAALEKNQTGERIERVKHQLARMGRHLGGPPPYGFVTQASKLRALVIAGMDCDDATIAANREYPKPRHLYIDPQEAKVVRIVFRLYVKDKRGCRAISNILNKQGWTRRSGLLWHPDKVRRIINDPVVAGFIPYDEKRAKKGRGPRTQKCDQHLYKGIHNHIIEKELWDQAQAIKKQNSILAPKVGNASIANRRYPLSGVIKCSCGKTMKAASTKRSIGKGYYTCRSRLDYGPDGVAGCNRPRISVKKADHAFWEKLCVLIKTPTLIDRVFLAAQRVLKDRSKKDPDHQDPTLQIAKLTKEIEVWYDRHDKAVSDIEKEASWNRIVVLCKRRSELQTLLTNTPAPDVSTLKILTRDRIAKHLAELADAIPRSKDAGKHLVQLLVEHHGLEVRVIDRETIGIRLGICPPGSNALEALEHPVHVEAIAELPLPEVDAWLKQHRGKCKCQLCEDDISVERRHYWRGLPKYHQACWLKENSRRRVKPSSSSYNGKEAAEKLGISRTTLGRLLKSGLMSEMKRSHGVLLFDKKTINRLASQGRVQQLLTQRVQLRKEASMKSA